MQYHSDYNKVGFRREIILSILEKHGIILSQDSESSTTACPQRMGQAPAWKQKLALRNRLSIFEATCALAGVDPFTEEETVDNYGINVAAYEMNKVLLDEAKRLRSEVSRMQSEATTQVNTNQQLQPHEKSEGLSFRHETALLRLVAEVQERYLGDNFDPRDSNTKPPQLHVIEWLRRSHSTLSEVDAKAVDRVAMPFKRGK